ncbi:P-loop containing nucleoside triphosphate hydrolase protein [Cyathus striatus]|nr:P-loop containing nucleoside triphosphate hydrolase protein [Cyathus striatus]
MARSATLNPASIPFFPGGARSNEEEGGGSQGFTARIFKEQDQSSLSSISISPSDYRSMKSSPSPPQDGRDSNRSQTSPAPVPREASRSSPSHPQTDMYSLFERTSEEKMMGPLDPPLEKGENYNTSGRIGSVGGTRTPGSSFYALQQQERELGALPPISVAQNSSYPSAGFTSSSPVSSLDSGSHFTSSVDQQFANFEARLKNSPLMHDILDRLAKYETSNRDIQHDLSELNRKVNLLVERALGSSTKPEFLDPFAPSSNGYPSSLSSRPSMGNIAPNQPAPSDDISSISQRLNTLTSSVGQLLALQTQQYQTSLTDTRNNNAISLNTSQAEIPPNQIVSPAALSATPGILNHGLSNRPDLRPSPRQPNPPMRTWSAGTLDLPVRPSDANLGRQDTLLRDNKRRSVSTLLRRESTGVLDSESWGMGSRESGPVISKWEQLNIAPELLRSLSKFGVGPPNKIQQRALPFLLRGADIIAQAPPTQERIAAYVIPAIQVAVTNLTVRRGPVVILVSTTVDQATQAQRMIRDLGGPIGVRSALGVGTTTVSSDLSHEMRLLQQNMPHIICGTPQKLHALFTSTGGLSGAEVRFLVLDEVDQLIARNLHDYVFNIVKLLPPPRTRPLGSTTPTPTATALTSPFDTTGITPFQNAGRRFSSVTPNSTDMNTSSTVQQIERQTALFSNTVPQDVLNLASAIQLREPVRVLVRRDGGVTNSEASQGSRGLRQYYRYLAFTAGSRSEPQPTQNGGHGIIGSGRGASNAESAQAREWKLDALADIFDDVDVQQTIVHVGGMTALDSVVYKLASRGFEAIPLHGDMNAGTKLAALNKFRNTSSVMMRQSSTRVLVVYDVQVKASEVSQIPLIINYDLPKAVEEYAHRVAPAIASNYSRAGVIVNFVTATGGDVEMLRSIECYYKIKCPEVPMSLRDIV